MSVRQSLLAILDQGPCYGYQLRSEFDRRTGSTWPVNVGQIYNTLERLERDGLVERGSTDSQGHVYWQITDAGTAEVVRWFSTAVPRGSGTRDELAMKVAVAATLPGVDALDLLRAQREESTRRLLALQSAGRRGDEDPEALARSLVNDSMRFAVQAELQWLDHVEHALSSEPRQTMDLHLATERPKRGRPALATGK
ncbi:PadR family transcriptional regulator [uncultured Microbacterium sp.]|uniref:PadR family transcriptional regulator n=1 Tax=uncultured Microbacterium sp. TaxID=191216 RepID=UPI002620F875|nr:PadR family transcriptional regulator [uncultured Microbacterium sp.]